MTSPDFDEWLSTSTARLKAHALTVTKSENWNQASRQGQWFDLEGAGAWGRVTFWPNGRGDVEIVDAATSRTVMSSPDVEIEIATLEDWLAKLFAANVS